MEPSVFTKIINGEIPSYTIYEDKHVICILNIHPAQPGHALVVPKIQVDRLEDLPELEYIALTLAMKKIMLHVREKLSPQRVAVKVLGFDVPHVHIHLIPMKSGSDTIMEDPNSEVDYAALAAMADTLRMT